MLKVLTIKKEALLPFFILVLISTALCLTSIGIFTYYDHKRWIVLLFLSALILVLVASVPLEDLILTLSFRNRNFILFLLSLYILVRGLIGFDINTAIDSLNLIFLFTFFFLVNRYSLLSNLRFVLLSIAFPFFLYYLLVLMQYAFVVINPQDWTIHILAVGFDNIRFLNQIQVLVFPAFIYLLVTEQKNLKKMALFLAVFTVALAIYSNGRGVLFVLIIESIFLSLYFKFYPGKQKTSYKLLLTVWLIGFIIYWFFLQYVPGVIFPEAHSVPLIRGESVRLAMWAEAIDLWYDNILFGIGGMTYSRPDNGFSYTLAHPHNSIIQVLLEYGIVGLGLITLFVGSLIRPTLKLIMNRNRQFEHFIIVISIVGAAGLSLVSGVIVMPISQFILILFISVVISEIDLHEKHFNPKLHSTIRFSSFFQKSLFLIITFFLLSFSFLSYNETMSQGSLLFDAGPRFWLIGRYL